MSALTALKFVAAKRPVAASPIVQRRNKISSRLWEQIELARALAEGKTALKLAVALNSSQCWRQLKQQLKLESWTLT